MVTVVDVKQALNQMQVLLARNDIPAHVLDDDAEYIEESAAKGRSKIGNKDRRAGAEHRSCVRARKEFPVHQAAPL